MPTWTLHADADDTIDFDDYQGSVENFMAHAVVYLDVPEDIVSSATVPALNPLTAGRHMLMVKVFDGLYGNGFRLRFQDPTGLPLAVGRILWDPEGDGGPRFHRGDPNDDGAVNITDAIFILNYLFLGGAAPPDPGPSDSPCGPDPSASPSDLGCETYRSC